MSLWAILLVAGRAVAARLPALAALSLLMTVILLIVAGQLIAWALATVASIGGLR